MEYKIKLKKWKHKGGDEYTIPFIEVENGFVYNSPVFLEELQSLGKEKTEDFFVTTVKNLSEEYGDTNPIIVNETGVELTLNL
mgnify:CR=1 FL=1